MQARRIIWFFISILGILSMAFGPPTLVDGDFPTRSLAPHQIRLMRQVPPPALTAGSWLLVNTTTRRVILSHRANERRAVGSLVKMVTAMVALQRGKLDKEIRVLNEDLVVSSSAGLQNGEVLSLRELLFFLLIPSDNAASMTIARSLGREVSTFVGWMNELVAQWGLKDTNFGNPSGLDHKNGYSTAQDMAVISLQAMTDPLFADIVRRSEASLAARYVKSTNELLNTYSGTVGVKTGTEERAGECISVLVVRPRGQVLCVVLGSNDRYRDTRLLVDYYYANYAELRIDLPQTLQNRYRDGAGNWREFKLREPVTYLISPWQVGKVSLYRRIDNLSANPNPAEPIGALIITLAGSPLSEVPLYAR